jgi:rod shape-determining protein MreC
MPAVLMALRRKFIQTKLFKALFVAVILALFMLFPLRILSDPLRSLFAFVAWPIGKVASFVSFEASDTFRFFSSIGSLKDENIRLEKERTYLLAENARLSDIVKDDETLREELGLLPRGTFALAAASVIGREDADGSGHALIIDRGALSGMSKGMPVIVSGRGLTTKASSGVLVGRIDQVFPASARVMLVSDPESRINAIVPDTDARGIVKGEHGLGALLDMVLQADTIRAGDTVVTSGLGGDMPEGLLVGTLQDPGFSPDRLFRRAAVVFPVRYDHLRYVFVITGPTDNNHAR